MSLIVSDASPLNILIRIDCVDVLPKLFKTVFIPPVVLRELSHPSTPPVVSQWVGSLPKWVEVRTPLSAIKVDSTSDSMRHAGEQEAIQLAVELHAPLLIDERKPRLWAESQGVAVVGTIGILERSAQSGFLTDLATAYDRIRASDFRIDPRILEDSLERHRARRKVN